MKIISVLKNISSKGFTLIELLIVIAILGVLAAGVLAAIDPADKIASANDARAQNDISALGRATETYATTHSNFYPADTNELVTSGELKRVPTEPSSDYTYVYVENPGLCTSGGTCTSVVIYSDLKSKKFTATPFWRYDSDSGKSCGVANVTITDPSNAGFIDCP